MNASTEKSTGVVCNIILKEETESDNKYVVKWAIIHCKDIKIAFSVYTTLIYLKLGNI